MDVAIWFTVELPFVLNLPDDLYQVRVEINGKILHVPVELANNMFRLVMTADPKSHDVFSIGTEAELRALVASGRIPENQPKAWQQLRTVVRARFAEELILTDETLASVSDDAVRKTAVSHALRLGQRDMQLVHAEVDTWLNNISAEERATWAEKTLIDKTHDRLRHNKDFFFEALNRLIAHYRVLTKDHFVERCTDHTLGMTYEEDYVDGQIFAMAYVVGKVPSWIKTPWHPAKAATVTDLKAKLATDAVPPGPLELLVIARNQLEKGEPRAAIIDASAALEAAVAQKITEKMQLAGKPAHEIKKYLDATKMDFSQRCGRQLHDWTRRSLTKVATLWGPVDAARKKYRHAVAHSDFQPSQIDAEQAVNAFAAAVEFVIRL